MSDSPNRGRRYQQPQGQGSYGPPPPYQGPQWQQPQQPQQPQQGNSDRGGRHRPNDARDR